MKVIFLDIDGVLNSHKDLLLHGPLTICDVYLERLSKIIKAVKPTPHIVLSSSWRILDSLKLLATKRLEDHKMQIHSCTSYKPPTWHDRNDEISEWLENHEVSKYAILDDYDMSKRFGENMFVTKFKVGLTDEVAELVIKHLNTGTPRWDAFIQSLCAKEIRKDN